MFRMIIVKSFLLFFHSIQFLAWNVQAAAGRDGTNGTGEPTFMPVHIGVVLNLNSTIGTMAAYPWHSKISIHSTLIIKRD